MERFLGSKSFIEFDKHLICVTETIIWLFVLSKCPFDQAKSDIKKVKFNWFRFDFDFKNQKFLNT